MVNDFNSKMKVFAKIKSVNYFCKMLYLDVWQSFECAFYSQSIDENSNVGILVYFKDWVILTHFKPPYHSY